MNSNQESGIVLRTGTVDDAAAAAALHVEQIGQGFLAILGTGFLNRLYRRVARTPGSFLLIVEDGEATVGFLAGSTDVAGLYRSFVLRDGAVAVVTCSGNLVRSWRRVLETFRHGTGVSANGAELLAVAVDPAMRGRGAGSLLVHGFLTELQLRRQDAAHVVVAADNNTAIALYARAGFSTAERFELHPGTESLLMQWTGSGTNPS